MKRVKISFLILLIGTTLNLAYSADPPPPQYQGPYQVVLKVGEIFILSKNVDIIRPITSPICDDLRIVNVVETPDGLAFKGISPGKTLCSVSTSSVIYKRRVFSITVNE